MDIIDALGQSILAELGVPYAGQEPQDKTSLSGKLVIIERDGGVMSPFGRSDKPWIRFTTLANTKKGASDLLMEVRQHVSRPRTRFGDIFVYGVEEQFGPENATAQRDAFYRFRATIEFHVKGLN